MNENPENVSDSEMEDIAGGAGKDYKKKPSIDGKGPADPTKPDPTKPDPAKPGSGPFKDKGGK